eukprot:4237738-Ditylum_brightwellii.AAC.1
MEDDLKKDMKDIKNNIKEREARWSIRNNRYLSMLSNTDASNKKRQQQHQDHDATVRIQSIFRVYSTQQQLHLQKISAISIQTVARGFIVQQQMITKHIATIIIQTNFRLAYQQRIIY